MSLQHGFRGRIGLLQIDAPVPQLFERDFRTGDGAADERARPNDTKITIEVPDFGLPRHGTIGAVEQIGLRPRSLRESEDNRFDRGAKPSGFRSARSARQFGTVLG